MNISYKPLYSSTICPSIPLSFFVRFLHSSSVGSYQPCLSCHIFVRFCQPLNILLSSSVRFYQRLCVIYDIASCHPMQQCFLFALVILCMSLSLFISLDTTCLSPSVHSCHLLYDTVIFYRLIYPLYVTFMSPTVCRCHPLYALVISYCV